MFAIARKRSAFSLIELVIVVVIIGIIAAIAIPRMSRGAQGANDSTLTGNLSILRKAIDLYAAEHSGSFPSSTDATFILQMTTYTDASGGTNATKDTTHIYGPYLRSVPKCPVGTYKGQSSIVTGTPGAAAGGWCYDGTAGTIYANSKATDVDAANVAYNTY